MSDTVELTPSQQTILTAADTPGTKLGNCQASTAEIIARGQAVLPRLECNLAWCAEWRDLLLALGAGRDLALHAAKTNKPHGPKYRAVIGSWLRSTGFDRIDEADRSRLLQCYDNLAAINTWHAALPAEVRQKLNHPRTVLARWKRSLTPAAEKKPTQRTRCETRDDVLRWFAEQTPDEQRQFLAALLKILPNDLRAELERRVAGLHRSKAIPDADKATKALRQALSHAGIAGAHNKAAALAGLNCLNNLLRVAGADLHDATVVIEAASVRQRAA